ncbi:MAG: cupredoxin domain-containing protein [Nanoarchaeota archaeon]|nr:cupredoxin domain-containing protein [Nanoarchaeota archaeon]
MKKILFALFIITLFLFGCVKQPVSEVQPEEVSKPVEGPEEPEYISEPIAKGTLNLFVSDQNNVVADFDSVEIVFNLVKVYKLKDSVPIEKEIDITADLTELQDSNALKILEIELDSGPYSKVKLYASSVKGVLLGNEVEVIIPGNTLAIERPFEIEGGDSKTFVADLEVVKTGKVTTTTGLERYNLQPVLLKSGVTSTTLIKEITTAEMVAKINEKAGKKFDRHVFMTEEAGFTPSEIVVEPGTKIIWENKDIEKLGIIMDGVFDRFVRAGGSYEHMFNRIGSFPYNMKFQISNAGKVTVSLPPEEVEEVTPLKSRTVEIKSTGFSPAELSVKKGTEVRFTNKDSKYHHIVTSLDAQRKYELAPGEAFNYVYNELGEFSFYDTYNVRDFSGKITVS